MTEFKGHVLETTGGFFLILAYTWGVRGFYGSSWRHWNSPDAEMYKALGRGDKVPDPYHRRWLVPMRNEKVWIGTTLLSILLSALILREWTGGVYPALIFLALPLIRINMSLLIGVDMQAMMFALFSAYTLNKGYYWASIPLALLAGASKETAPIFAALYAWHPLPLIGLLAVRWRGASVSTLDWLPNPKEALHKFRGAHDFLDWKTMLLPWGALPLSFLQPTTQLVATVLVAYSQLLVASDEIRLYQWAAPVVIMHLPRAYEPFALLTLLFTPFSGV